jgi:hypothetical protein
MHSSPTTIFPHQSSFAPSPPSFTYSSAQSVPAIASQSEDFQTRESQPNTAHSPVRSLLKKTASISRIRLTYIPNQLMALSPADDPSTAATTLADYSVKQNWHFVGAAYQERSSLFASPDSINLAMVTKRISMILWAC